MRPEERINNFLKILGDEWKKQGVDLRFTQFLFNNGIVDMNRLHYIEEHELLQKYFPHIDPAEYIWWGTRGKDGKSKLKYILLKNMDTDHIEAILETQKHISVFYREVFEKELEKRKNGNNC